MQRLLAMRVEPTAFDQVPFLKYCCDERVVNLASFWDGEHWHMWWPHNGGLIKMQGGECVEGGYFAATPERETDVFLQFADFMWKHASWHELARWLSSIEQNVFRIATSLAKIDHFNGTFAAMAER